MRPPEPAFRPANPSQYDTRSCVTLSFDGWRALRPTQSNYCNTLFAPGRNSFLKCTVLAPVIINPDDQRGNRPAVICKHLVLMGLHKAHEQFDRRNSNDCGGCDSNPKGGSPFSRAD